MKRLGIFAAALLLAACQPLPGTAAGPTQDGDVEVDTTDVPPARPVPETTTDVAACSARGGEIRRIGRLQAPTCVVRYADAGKRCTDGSQCLGDCRAEADMPAPPTSSAAPARTPVPATREGRCQADSNPFGCYTRLEGGEGVTLCVD